MTDKDIKSSEAEELREILEAVQETVPALISRLVQSIYSPKVAESIAEAVGTLYQNLKKKGLPDDLVLEMTQKYMSVLDIKELMSEGIRMDRPSKNFDIEVRRTIEKKRADREKG